MPGFLKRLSIGLTLYMQDDEYRNILDWYHPFIYDVYFSPPLGRAYHTRAATAQVLEDEQEASKLWRLLAYAQSKGIKLKLALNSHQLSTADVLAGLEFTCEHLQPDSVVTLPQFGPPIRRRYPTLPLTVSFNAGINRPSQLTSLDGDVFDTITAGRGTIRDFRFFRLMKQRGFQTILLLNNGCAFNCPSCSRPDQVPKTFARNCRVYPANHLYALQTLLPFELHHYGYLTNKNIDRFKISNRPCDYLYLKRVLESYLRNLNQEMTFFSPATGRMEVAYRLWCRGSTLVDHLDKLDFHRIGQIKQAIWEKRIQLPLPGQPADVGVVGDE